MAKTSERKRDRLRATALSSHILRLEKKDITVGKIRTSLCKRFPKSSVPSFEVRHLNEIEFILMCKCTCM